MLDLAIIALLLIGLLVGLRRGFILQVIHLTGFIVAFIVAYIYYDGLAPKLHLWIPFPSMGDSSSVQMLFSSVGLDTAYYNAISFAIIFFITKIVWQMLGSMLDFFAHLPIVKAVKLLGWRHFRIYGSVFTYVHYIIYWSITANGCCTRSIYSFYLGRIDCKRHTIFIGAS